jgi:type II secretory pathway component PulF
MATAAVSSARRDVKEYSFTWEGRDRSGKVLKGDMRASGEAVVQSTLRRQGIAVIRVKRQRSGLGGKIKEKDITLFTRQLATMMKAGVPLLQAFDIVGKGHNNPAVGRLLMDIKTEVETGSALNTAFRKYPIYFDALFCNLVGRRRSGRYSGQPARSPRRLTRKRFLAIKSKIKAALFYPISIIVVAFVITAVIMIFVIPAFKDLFSSFGADLPGPTLLVIALSDFFVHYWWLIFGGLGFGLWFFFYSWKRSVKMQAGHGSHVPATADLRRHHSQSHGGALDAYARDHVCCRRAAGRGARLGGRRIGQLRVRAGYPEDSTGSEHRYQPHGRDAEQRRVQQYGDSDGGHRRRIRLAGCDAVQGRRLL